LILLHFGNDHPVSAEAETPLLIEEGSNEKTLYQLSSLIRRSTPTEVGGRWFKRN
jgi:hypothetical protein